MKIPNKDYLLIVLLVVVFLVGNVFSIRSGGMNEIDVSMLYLFATITASIGLGVLLKHQKLKMVVFVFLAGIYLSLILFLYSKMWY